MPTKELAASIINSMGVVSDGDLLNVYSRHLALFVCIIIFLTNEFHVLFYCSDYLFDTVPVARWQLMLSIADG